MLSISQKSAHSFAECQRQLQVDAVQAQMAAYNMLVQYKKVWAVWHICAFDGHMQRRHMQRVLQYVA